MTIKHIASSFSAPPLPAAAGADSLYLDPRVPAGPADWLEQQHKLAPDKDSQGDETGEEV